MKTFTAYIEWNPEAKVYVGIIPSVPGAYTQAASLDELRENLKEVLELCLEEARESGEPIPRASGVESLVVEVRKPVA